MPQPKYFDRIAELEATDAARLDGYEFDFQDLGRTGFAGYLAELIPDNMGFILKFFRRYRPIAKVAGAIAVTRHEDVKEVLTRDDIFEVPFGREMKATTGGGNFILGMQKGPEYERQKRWIFEVFKDRDLAAEVAPLAFESARELLQMNESRIDAVGDLITKVPTRICRHYYGIAIPDEDRFGQLAIAMSALYFADPFGREENRRAGLAAGKEFSAILQESIERARAGEIDADTVLGRLVALQAGTDGPADDDIRAILTGMIVGFVPTNTLAGGNILRVLFERPDAMRIARQAAAAGDDDLLTGCLFEALRFRPALNPGVWRYANADYTVAAGTRRAHTIKKGTTVLASTMSAMLDPRSIDKPHEFRPDRPVDDSMVFGFGLHWCIGAGIAKAQIAQTFKALLLQDNLRKADGDGGRLHRVGPFPARWELTYGNAITEHRQSYVTVCIPMRNPGQGGAGIAAVEKLLDGLGNPASDAMRAAIDATNVVHFCSMHAIACSRDEKGRALNADHLVLEMSVDGDPDIALARLARHAGDLLRPVLKAATNLPDGASVLDLLRRHSKTVAPRWYNVHGLCFSGTPGLDVARIRNEGELESFSRAALTEYQQQTAHQDRSPLAALRYVRRALDADGRFGWATQRAYLPFTDAAKAPWLHVDFDSPWPRLRALIGGSPFLFAIAAVAILTVAGFTYWFVLGGRGDGIAGIGEALRAVSKVLFSLIWGTLVVAGLASIGIWLLLRALRRRELADTPEDRDVELARVAEIMERENAAGFVQNHMAAVSHMKPGRLRRFTLLFAFYLVEKSAAAMFRPGFLRDIGTIHFARWVKLPNTDKLLFFSNYGGSWESYLEDFITKGHSGLTAVWSNTYDFPRARYLLFDGATDGDRFKRWARNQQIPTRFWYSAYPQLTTERIRTNAIVRDGIARIHTNTDAQAWLDLFGSIPRPAEALEFHDIQAIAFGALKPLNEAACLALRMPDDMRSGQAWLKALMARGLAFGDELPGDDRARVIAFAPGGLAKLGLAAGGTVDGGEQSTAAVGPASAAPLSSFPPAFLAGMADPTRARVLGDIGDSAPEHWQWGGPGNPVDAVLIVLSRTADTLAERVAAELEIAASAGIEVVANVPMRTMRDADGRSIEPFGFADGVSQPVIRGTRRYHRGAADIHVIDPGEFILGYPDARRHYPPTPQVDAKDDPLNRLASMPADAPLRFARFSSERTFAPRDLGRNGSYLVIRQLQQHVDAFDAFLEKKAAELAPQFPDEPVTPGWLGAKLVGRWKDGTPLAREPNEHWDDELEPRPKVPDNSFRFGIDDPQGYRCPYGAHVRRANPRDSFEPGDDRILEINNRHRILRVGRPYLTGSDGNAEDAGGGGGRYGGLMFMCVQADIERQFEFIQQTWVSAPSFHGLRDETDAITATTKMDGSFTVPTPQGAIHVDGLKPFVTVRGGGYFFLPSRRALRYLSEIRAIQPRPQVQPV